MDTDPRPRRLERTRTAFTGLAALLLLGITQPAHGQSIDPAARDNGAQLNLSTDRPHMRSRENSEWWRSGGGGYEEPSWELAFRLAGPGETFASQQEVDLYRYRAARGQHDTGWYDPSDEDFGSAQETETTGSVSRRRIRIGIRIPLHEREQ